jgi:hypothetical protein
MNSQISSESSDNSPSLSSFDFSSLPRVVTSLVFQHLNFGDKKTLRESSRAVKFHVDDHIRRKYLQWRKKTTLSAEKLSHEKILLAAIDQFVALNFHPPYILTLIEKTLNIATSCGNIWREYGTPMKIEEREKLLRIFYEESDKIFNEKEKKILFTLTILEMLKLLDPNFSLVHPFNRKTKLRISFSVFQLFFAIPFYNFAYDWFDFDRDWVQVLLVITKFLEIKAAIAISNHVRWVNLVKPVVFEFASIFFGKKNPCSRFNTVPRVKSTFRISADRDMIGEIKRFLESGEFDWTKAADCFRCDFKFLCLRSKVGKCWERKTEADIS